MKNKRSASTFFTSDKRNEINKANPEKNGAEITRLCADKWKACSTEDRQPYVKMQQADALRFAEEEKKWINERNKWNKTHPNDKIPINPEKKRKVTNKQANKPKTVKPKKVKAEKKRKVTNQPKKVKGSSNGTTTATIAATTTAAPPFATLIAYNTPMEQRSISATIERTGETSLSTLVYLDVYRYPGVTQYSNSRPDIGKLSRENGNLAKVLLAFVRTPFVLDLPAFAGKALHDASVDVAATMFSYMFYCLPENAKRIAELNARLQNMPSPLLIKVDKTKQQNQCKAEGCSKSATYAPVEIVTAPNEPLVIAALHLPDIPCYCKEHAVEEQKEKNIPLWDVTNRLCANMGGCLGEYHFDIILLVLLFLVFF